MNSLLRKAKARTSIASDGWESDTTTVWTDRTRVFLKERTYCRNKRQLCTKLGCKYSNPPQAAAGKYTCLGCTSGTYIVLPKEIMHANSYPILPSPSKGAQRRALERIEAERREELASAKRKPLPQTPGLARRAASPVPHEHARFVEVARPPAGDVYHPPLRAKHSTATRNLRQRQQMYAVSEPGSSSQVALSFAFPVPSVATSATSSKSTSSSGNAQSRSQSPACYYPSPASSATSTGSQRHIYDRYRTPQYEVLNNGRAYF